MQTTTRFSSTAQKEDGLIITEKTIFTKCPPGPNGDKPEEEYAERRVVHLSNFEPFLIWRELSAEEVCSDLDGEVYLYGFKIFDGSTDIKYNAHCDDYCFSAMRPAIIRKSSVHGSDTPLAITKEEEARFTAAIHRVLGR
jgi:hypothetical protein